MPFAQASHLDQEESKAHPTSFIDRVADDAGGFDQQMLAANPPYGRRSTIHKLPSTPKR